MQLAKFHQLAAVKINLCNYQQYQQVLKNWYNNSISSGSIMSKVNLRKATVKTTAPSVSVEMTTTGRKLNIKKELKKEKESIKDEVQEVLEIEVTEADQDEADSTAPTMKRPKWEPKNWQMVLENIRKMRSGKDAPVDSMGCERTMEEHVDPKTKRYQALVSLMLSSQTKDQINYAAMQRLQQDIGLNVQTILNTDESVIGLAIKPVSFWNRKATYIKKTTQLLRDQYNDDIPDTVAGLCSLPGVGPKMAHICMNVAWNQNTGIGVDTHVHRIANRLQWTGPKETKTPEKTREGLESWMDPNLWQEINIMLVGFGQTVCTAVNPKCSECLNNELCSFGKSQLRNKDVKKVKGKKKVTKTEIDYDEDDDGEISKYF